MRAVPNMSMFSIIIPSYNRATLLAATIESVLAQRYTDYEVIVVDDGSIDRTSEYLRSLGRRVNPFRQPNRGPGSARNLGVTHAQGKYLAFLDSDDVWFPWTLEVYREVIRNGREPSFVVGKPYIFSEDNELAGA